MSLSRFEFRNFKWVALAILSFLTLMSCSSSGGAENSSHLGLAITAAVITLLSAFIGGFLPLTGKVSTNKNLLDFMTNLSAGFLIALAFLIIVPEGFELVMEGEVESFDVEFAAGLALLVGFIAMMVFESLGLEADDDEPDEVIATESQQAALVVFIGLTIDALGDGLAVGAAVATGELGLTLPLLIGLAIQRLPSAFSLTALNQYSGAEKSKGWRKLIIFGVSMPIAILLSYFVLRGIAEVWLGLVILFSGGIFIYVSASVLSTVLRSSDNKLSVAAQVVGGAIFIIVLLRVLEAIGVPVG